MRNLEKLFNPSSIAIVGVSAEEGKVGNVIAKNISTLGYEGEVFFVNPKHSEIFGKKCYSELKEIKEKIDLAIIVIPAKFVNRVIKESAKLVKNFVIISAGFAEVHPVKSPQSGVGGAEFNGAGNEGKKREAELKKIAEENNLNILGPNCLGFIIPSLKLNASFAGGIPEAGNISFVSQSGALAVAMMDIAKNEGIKFSSIISIGNKMQIDETELLEYLGEDGNTKVIGMYLEGIKNGAKFMAVAQKISRKKPIVALKAGKSEKAQKAISSHTGALAGSDATISALFEKAGILRASDLEDFFSLINLISRTEAPANDKVAVITNAGGPGVLTADAFLGKEMKLANLSEESKNNLRELLPEESSVENPIDLLGDAMEDRYKKTLEIIGKEKEIGTIICVLTPQDQTPVEKIADEMINFKNKSGKNIISIFIGGDRVKKAISNLKKNNIPNFSFPDQGIDALDKYYNWGKARERILSVPEMIDENRQAKAEKIIEKVRAEKRQALIFYEAQEIMELYGIKTIDTENISSSEKILEKILEKISFPAVLKVDSDKVLHKTDRQGVILNIKNKEELESAIKKMKKNLPGENLIVQPMLERQTELIIGIKNDLSVGPIVICGLGGIYTEIFKIADFLIPPLSTDEIKRSLLKGKLNFLFRETRGQKVYDLGEISQILFNISALAGEIPEIKELDINPLLVYNDGTESVAVDVKIII